MIAILKAGWSAVSGALGGIWLYVAVAAVAASLSAWAAVHVTSLGYEKTISDLKAEQATQSAANANAVLAQFAADAGQVHAAAVLFGQQQTDMASKFDALSRDFKNAVKARPLPANCAPDAERLRVLSAAVSAANAARTTGQQTSRTVP